MSVLYKALQKAEKENEQRQTTTSGKGFDPERLAGSGAIKLARGHGLNWRLAAFAGVGLLAILAGGLYFVTQTQPTPAPKLATLTPPAPKVAPAPQSATPAPPPSANAPSAPSQTAPTPPTPVESTTAQSAPQPASEQPAAASGETQVAQAPPGTTAPTPTSPTTQNAETATPAVQQSKPEVPPASAETQAAKAAEPPPMPAPAAAKPVAPAPPREKPTEIPANSPAQALNPPISIARADFALSGVGRAVQVRQIAQDAQDNVGAGYNALLRGEYDTALGFYDRAIQKEPTSVLALLGRGAALQKLRRFDDAQDAYTKALKVDPENREALTNVTAIIAERSPAEALNRLSELEKQYPTFSPIKAQMGLLYGKAGSLDQALDYLHRAVALSPESVMYQYNLALVLDHMNLREQAIDAYERVLSAITLRQAPPELSSTDIERRVRFLRAR